MKRDWMTRGTALLAFSMCVMNAAMKTDGAWHWVLAAVAAVFLIEGVYCHWWKADSRVNWE